MTVASSSIWWAIIGIIGVVILGTLFFFFLAFLFELPELVRSIRLSKLAKKYNLKFIRAKKGWRGGWISLDVGEKNFISGKINNILLSYSDLHLIRSNLGIGFNPSIAEADSQWSGAGWRGSTTKNVSKLNNVVYSRLSLKDLYNLLESIKAGQITSESAIYNLFEKKDFSKQLMRNYKVAWWICGFIFFLSAGITTIINPNFSNFSLLLLVIFNLCINFPIFLWTSKAYGKKFNPKDINKVPEINNFLDDNIKLN